MADFPSLTPSSRTFTPEEYAGAAAIALGGKQSRVAHSTSSFGAQLRLSFIGLTEAERFSIEAHYHGQQGGFLAFELPAEMFADLTGVVDPCPLWRYAVAPEIEDFCGPHHDITVTLESVTS